LIVSEAEIEESVQRLDRACARLAGGQLKQAAGQ
jgi:acetylornithine/N-succinyldiaminopimelate aminotransferase